jgi:hypothetical protein
MTKLKALGSLGAATLLFASAAGWACYQWGVSEGRSAEREIQAQAVQAWQRQTRDALAQLEQERRKRNEQIQQSVRVIREAPDPEGCNRDTTLGDELDRLCAEGVDAAC